MFRFTKAHPRSPAVAFGKLKGNDTLKKLKSFLNANEPKTVEWLVNFWNAQGNAITYKELREAVLSGSVSNAQLKKWQKQYANLVNTALAPQWYEAIKAAGSDLKAQYPYFLYEPFVGEMQDYIYKHSAELVTALAKEQKDALRAMISNGAHYSGMTPDDLSRLMRPAIGLTKPQAVANLNFYQNIKESLLKAHPRMTDASAAAKARTAAAKYAAKQHRYRAMNIARTELAGAYNQGHFGATKNAQAQGYIGECQKFFVTADDERMCPICGAMDGETQKMDEPFSFGKLLPPVHPSCRCAVGYRETKIPLTVPQNSGTINTQAQHKPKPNPVNQPEIPPNIAVPKGMTYNGEINLGGTGRMYSYYDADGNEWLFKPAQNKAGKPELFRAYSQEVGYKVQGIVDPDSAVQVGTGTLDGRFGAFQRRVNTVSGKDFKSWQNGYGMSDADITPEMVEQFQREHVTDWLLGNFDSHGGNFVTDVSGKIIGIDKEQAFKYLSDVSSRTMSYKYHPNAKYGETEPIYNTLFRKYAHGDIDINPQNTLKYIQRLESIPDSEYREIFRNYAESLCGKGKAAEQMLDSILARKSSLRETYRTFYTDLMAERTGTVQTFKWADEIMGSVKPLKAPKTVAVPRVKPSPKTPKVPVKTESGYKIDEIMDDLSVLPHNQHGVALRSDGGMVEGLNVTGRRVTIDGADYYEFSGKLTEESWEQAAKTVQARGNKGKMDFLLRDSAGGYNSKDSGMKLDAYRIADKTGKMEIYSDTVNKDQFGMAGYFRVRVPVTGNAAADKKAIQEMFDKSGLAALTSSPTDADELLLKKTRLAWQRNPAAFEKARYLTGSAREKAIDDILKNTGIDPSRVNRMTLKEVFPGYSTYVDDAAFAEYQNAGLTHIWAGVDNADSVVAICKSDGFSATNYRITSGMKKCGASPGADMESGGSDSVFTRIGVRANNEYSDSYLGGSYRVIIDPQEMARTDWYAFDFDHFGKARPEDYAFQSRMSGVNFVKSLNNKFQSSNEIMFRHGISTDKFVGISCENDRYRQELLTKFKAAGITEFNGIPIDKFVTVTTKIQEDSARGLAAALKKPTP